MEDKNNYEVLVYKSPSPRLVEGHAQVLRDVLLNGVMVKETMSSLVVNPDNGYFTFNFTPQQSFSYTPQEESEAREQLDRIISVLTESMKNYVRAGRLPEAFAEMFTAGYFKQTTLLPVTDPAKGDLIEKWSAQYVVELDAIQNRSDRTKTKAILNEGFSLVFGNDTILEVHYFHLPLQKGGREKLIAAENSRGEQKKEIYYTRNRDNTVVPFFISDQGLLPASKVSVSLGRDTSRSNSGTDQFPQEYKPGFTDSPPMAFAPGAGQMQDLLQAMQFGNDMDCLEYAFHIAITSACNRIRSAVWQFNVDMDEEVREDSAQVKIGRATLDYFIDEMVEDFGFIGKIGLALFKNIQNEIGATKQPEGIMQLKQLSAIWVRHVDSLSQNQSAKRTMYRNFLNAYGYKPAENPAHEKTLLDHITRIASGAGGVEGLPNELDVQRYLIQAFVGTGVDGNSGYIQCYFNYTEVDGDHIYEYFSYGSVFGSYYPTFVNVSRLERVNAMVKKLWPGVWIIKLPFDIKVELYRGQDTLKYFKSYDHNWDPGKLPGEDIIPNKFVRRKWKAPHNLSKVTVDVLGKVD